MSKPLNLGLHLTAREYLTHLLITNTDADENELREILLYLNNLLTLDEINLRRDGVGEI
ncbi:hypothetical protein [Vibrio mangrovi]|uniref:Uncharacterized protein n=1 Tax=Vibrio mangrovi TaxID=474394 RepID=A0A1Y6IZ46_9VIBR|nr:hypothetical protein [Vibrio mangrovi]MDW6005319.1 hypothetical protein [Vibrio mangrovi]SMS02945.1 hypothetical protein VIM7927_04307 [Vibrio mangrovi]